MIPIAVAPTRFVRGIEDPQQVEQQLDVVDFAKAFKDDWATDAHFVGYRPSTFEPGQSWPRINKSCLSKIRALGVDLLTNLFVFDYDNPGHRPWQPGEWEQFLERLATAAAAWPMIADFRLLYSTRNGARLVYLSAVPLPVDAFEDRHRWMVQEFRRHGIEVDKLSDWTRLFRLPYVRRSLSRDETVNTRNESWEATGTQPIIFEEQPEKFIDASLLGTLGGNDRSVYGEIVPISEDIPKYDDAIRLVYTSLAKDKRTDWAKRAMKALGGRECFDTLFNNTPIISGSRNNTLTKYVGQVIGVLLDSSYGPGVEGTTPSHVYGLFLDCVDQLQPDAQTPSWHDVLWSLITRTYAKQSAKITQREEVKQAQEVVGATFSGEHRDGDAPVVQQPLPPRHLE